MTNLEYIIDFSVHYAKELIEAGTNIERVNYNIARVLNAYNLEDVSMHLLSTFISLSARDNEGNYCQRQIKIEQSLDLDLEKMKNLNRLSHIIAKEKCEPIKLKEMLHEVEDKKYPIWVTLIAYFITVLCIGRMFNGGIPELLIIEVNTFIIYGLGLLSDKIKLNKMISSFISMFIVVSIALLSTRIGFTTNHYSIIIVNSLFLFPGIPLVNAARNILCGNEMNGVIELLKILLNVLIICAGIGLAFYFFDKGLPTLEESIVDRDPRDFFSSLELIILSFFASLGLGVVFNINIKDVLFAGLGGAIIRTVYILFQIIVPYTLAYTIMSSFIAALYSEIIAISKKEPSTLYLYPSIIPIIPGGLFYYSSLGIIWQNSALFNEYAPELLLALSGISAGFVLCSSFVYYIRKFKFKAIFEPKRKIAISKK